MLTTIATLLILIATLLILGALFALIPLALVVVFGADSWGEFADSVLGVMHIVGVISLALGAVGVVLLKGVPVVVGWLS